MYKKVLLFLGLILSTSNVYAFGFKEMMNVHIGIFDAANIQLSYEEKNRAYNIHTEVKTDNFFNTMYPFVGGYGSEGVFGNGGIIPHIYKTYTKTRNNHRTKTIFYDDKGKAYKRVSTKNKKKNEVTIDNVPLSASSADLQSIFAELIGNFSRTRRCQLQREVYDGKKYYKVIVKDKGSENKYFDYLGRTENSYKCSIYIENLKDNNDNILWDVSADKPIFLWIGIDKKLNLPYVLEIKIDSTPLGELKVVPVALESN